MTTFYLTKLTESFSCLSKSNCVHCQQNLYWILSYIICIICGVLCKRGYPKGQINVKNMSNFISNLENTMKTTMRCLCMITWVKFKKNRMARPSIGQALECLGLSCAEPTESFWKLSSSPTELYSHAQE